MIYIYIRRRAGRPRLKRGLLYIIIYISSASGGPPRLKGGLFYIIIYIINYIMGALLRAGRDARRVETSVVGLDTRRGAPLV